MAAIMVKVAATTGVVGMTDGGKEVKARTPRVRGSTTIRAGTMEKVKERARARRVSGAAVVVLNVRIRTIPLSKS